MLNYQSGENQLASYSGFGQIESRAAPDESPTEIDLELDTDIKFGLTDYEAKARMAIYGSNEVSVNDKEGLLFFLLRQFQSSVVVLLLFAGFISLVLGEHTQAAAILIAVMVNAGVGFITEIRAKISLDTLSKLSSPSVRARRNGQELNLPTSELVPGDVVALESGLRVPADVILAETCGIKVDESTVTGESVPVVKVASPDRGEESSVYQGTLIVAGNAWAIVVSTGDRTRVGQLGRLLVNVAFKRTPLEEKLEELGKQLSWWTLGICALLALIGIWHREPIWSMVQTSIALAVAAIPEGLPVVATLALAFGTQRMIRLGVLVRQLSAVETLGCCQVICTDKTGTLTENRMQVTDVVIAGKRLSISGIGYQPIGRITENSNDVILDDEPVFLELLAAGALCNDALVEDHFGSEDWHVHGDPTEGALIVAACKAGLNHDQLISRYPRVAEISFDLTRKRMTTIHSEQDMNSVCFTKGSPESVFRVCTEFVGPNGPAKLTSETLDWFRAQNVELSGNGLRVLAVAKKRLLVGDESLRVEALEKDLTLLGLIGMSDRPKVGVGEALESCRQAGIRVVMLTGDQAPTARAVARELKIIDDDSRENVVAIGSELNRLLPQDLETTLSDVSVIARVSPEMKLSVVRALQNQGQVVAMTGDGVNDAPALRHADIGVVMGKAGADLARESAKIVITDDNFGTIVKAIEQGRVIYSNIQRAIAYLLTASLASVMTVAGAVMLDIGLPLLPLQLLWLNLIMHIFPALGIAIMPSHHCVMKDSPRDPSRDLIGGNEQMQIFLRSLVVFFSVLIAAVINAHFVGHSANMTTINFATLSLALLFQAWLWALAGRDFAGAGSIRTLRPSLIGNMALSYALLFVAIYAPPLATVLKTVPLGTVDWLVVLSISFLSAGLSIPIARLSKPISEAKY